MKRVQQIVLRWRRKLLLLFLALPCIATISVYAQTGALSPYQDEENGISAGGKWMQFRSEDKMTGARQFRFELRSDNSFRQDPDYNPGVELLFALMMANASRP